MSKFQRCGESVTAMVNEVLCAFESHKPLLDARVKIDLVFAFADMDEEGSRTSHALTKNGVRALGIARSVPLKDRALGRADVEIAIDGDWFVVASTEEQRALLDHELYHFSLKLDKHGAEVRDDLGRPVIKLRQHDYEFGWFDVVASRHGPFSIERQFAKKIMDRSGQLYWPELIGAKLADAEA